MQSGNKIICDILKKEGIELVGVIPYSAANIISPQREKYLPVGTKSVICFAIPYFVNDNEESNISNYAIAHDYHFYIEELGERIIPLLEEKFKGECFYLTADKSPIDERLAAAKAGLGIIGENSLLITEKYSSYVFIAEIFTSMTLDYDIHEIKYCEGCGVCKKACPKDRECLSFLTQKKGELTGDEIELIRENGCAWGCDACQKVCPHSRNVKNTEIEFFKNDRIPYLTLDRLDKMSDEEFSKRAYAWRGRKTIARNLSVCGYTSKDKK